MRSSVAFVNKAVMQFGHKGQHQAVKQLNDLTQSEAHRDSGKPHLLNHLMSTVCPGRLKASAKALKALTTSWTRKAKIGTGHL